MICIHSIAIDRHFTVELYYVHNGTIMVLDTVKLNGGPQAVECKLLNK